MSTAWSDAHKVFLTVEGGMVAIEMVSDAAPVRRMHLDLTPLEARSLARWLDESADEAGGSDLREKYLHESVYAEVKQLRAERDALRRVIDEAMEEFRSFGMPDVDFPTMVEYAAPAYGARSRARKAAEAVRGPQPCPECRGTGDQAHGVLRCEECLGTGTITVMR
jgi:hypothetical protein